jgi:hypothetical protein
MDETISDIKKLIQRNLSLTDISKKLKISRTTLYGICKRHNIQYEKKTGGRTEGAYDKKPRKRRGKKKIIGGNNDTITLHNPSEAEEFIRIQDELLQKELSNLQYKYTNQSV